jgi:glycosyltransferase involved in cell wall biosynthesis
MPTYNSARYLRRCLESFRAQTFDDWELLCVDRGSNDGTLQILDEFARAWPRMRVLDGGSERTSQINIGVRASDSDFIYYTASDFDVDRDLLKDAVQAARSSKADGVFINCVSHGDGYWARVRNLERSTYFGSVKFEGVRFFTRAVYLAVDGYDDAVPIFEEYDLQDRMLAHGARFTRIDTAVERHLGEPQTLGEIWRKSFYYGTSYRSLLKKQGPAALRHANPIRSTFFLHWRRFFRHPILAAGFIVMLVAKYGGGATGFLWSLMRKNR